MKKYLKPFAWVCGAIALGLMMLGVVAVILGGSLMHHNWANYFYPAYNFIVLGMFGLMLLLVEKRES